jgi:small subunit ribosomal protein S8
VLTDPIADMLTRIRNGGRARLARVSMPESRMKREIARVLQENGFVKGFQSSGDAKKPELSIDLRYARSNRPMIESDRFATGRGLPSYRPRGGF